MSKEPLVSIIINCFNGEKYLHQSLESVISQRYKNWEIIFWDNQSTDSSSKIFKKYKDSRFKYFLATKHSKFLYEARNHAIEKAQELLKDQLTKSIPTLPDVTGDVVPSAPTGPSLPKF